MESLYGKRLLVLGGNSWAGAIESFAKENGIVLIAAGNNPRSNVFEIAAEGYDIDSTDADAMKKLIADKKIDGVYMGGNEPVIAAASVYVNELGMPCYCTREQWDILQDKSKFKELCARFGLPVVKQYDLNDDVEFPVITKPTDGCGSSGFSVCRNREELKLGYQRAMKASRTGSVLIEKFVKNDSIGIFYTMSEGKPCFSGMQDKYSVRYEQQGSYVGGLYCYESGFKEKFREAFEEKLTNLFQSIALKEGPVWIEVFCNNEEFYFNEVGYRYGGSVTIYPVDYFYGINQVAADITYALTGISRIRGFQSLIPQNIERKEKYATYVIHVNSGKICRIEGVDELMKLNNVVAIPQTKRSGDFVSDTGTVGQNFAYVHFTYQNIDELRSMIRTIQSTVRVLNENGENLVNPMINADSVQIR